jgi:hypothetical protein
MGHLLLFFNQIPQFHVQLAARLCLAVSAVIVLFHDLLDLFTVETGPFGFLPVDPIRGNCFLLLSLCEEDGLDVFDLRDPDTTLAPLDFERVAG